MNTKITWKSSKIDQALTILAHFHALCTLERSEDFGCLNLSKDFGGGGKENSVPRVNPTPSYLLMVQVCSLTLIHYET